MGLFSKNVVALVFVSLGMGVALSACVREQRFVRREARAWCHYEVECGRYRSVSDCMGAVAENIEDPYLVAAINAGRVDYDAAAAGRCIRAIKDLKCTRGEEDAFAAATELCAEVMAGQVAPDEPCMRNAECLGIRSQCAFVSGSCSGDSCCPGVCRYIEDGVELGEPCSSAAICAKGTSCVSTDGGESLCTERPDEGELCNGRCLEGLICLRNGNVDRRCYRMGVLGEPCAESAPCDGGWCNNNGICARFGGVGEPCSESYWENACRENHLLCVDGKCREPARVGESCSELPCIEYAYCVDDTCIEYKSSGQDCSENEDYCYDGLDCKYDLRTRRCGPGREDLVPTGNCPQIE